MLIHSALCGFRTKRQKIRLANKPLLSAIKPLLHSNTFTLVIQQSLFCCPIVPLSDCKRGFMVKRGCCLLSKTQPKTANRNSRINFYFVTFFYSFGQYLHGGQLHFRKFNLYPSLRGGQISGIIEIKAESNKSFEQ